MSQRDPQSPCVNLCNFNPFLGQCDGCFRTLDEIGGWSTFSPEQKREVLAKLKERRAAAEAAARET